MTGPGTLLFFSSTVPIPEGGSFVIFRRHFLPLVEAGAQLSVFSNWGAPAGTPVYWRHVVLKLRRWYWPPHLPSFLTTVRLRSWLAAGELARRGDLEGPGPRIVLTNLWDPQALIARAVAERYRLPLGVFVHDDELRWRSGSEPVRFMRWKRNRVLDGAHQIWSVSNRLTGTFSAAQQRRTRLLRPIPGSAFRAARAPTFRPGLHVGYAGKVYPRLEPVLEALAEQLRRRGGQLTVIGRSWSSATGAGPVAFQTPFATPEQAMQWLRENCSALVVAHPAPEPAADPAWHMLDTSFPSKLPEFVQLGLPLILLAPADSEFGDWCRAQSAVPWFASAADPALGVYLESLGEHVGWERAASGTRQLAATQFDPEQIQATFLSDLSRLSASSPA